MSSHLTAIKVLSRPRWRRRRRRRGVATPRRNTTDLAFDGASHPNLQRTRKKKARGFMTNGSGRRTIIERNRRFRFGFI